MRIQRPQLLFSGIVLVSLAAHGLVLQMPWREGAVIEPEPSVSTEEARTEITAEIVKEGTQAIAVTTLPAALPKPKPQTTAQPPIQTQPPIPQAASQPVPQLAQVEPPPDQVLPVQTPPQPAPEPISVPATEPLAEPQPEPLAQPSNPDTDTPEPTQPLEPEHGMVVQLGDRFPHFQNSESGCYGLDNCHRIAGEGTYRQAGKKLVEQMKADGFRVEERDDIDEQGHRVFAIVSPDEPTETYFLNVFSDDSDSTIYAVTLEIVSLAELQQLSS